MKTRHEKSLLPLFGVAGAWLVWALLLPLYRTSDFLLLAGLSAGVYLGLSRLFPGRELPAEEAPRTTGDPELDALLAAGREAAARFDSLAAEMENGDIRDRARRLGELCRKIFAALEENPGLKPQVKRFADIFLPAPLKLLASYRKLEAQGVRGENIDAAMGRIAGVLDATIDAYTREIDALFEGRALDIETDIEVLEQMMKREGLTAGDF